MVFEFPLHIDIDNIIIGKRFQMSYDPIICINDISDHLPLVLSIKDIDPYKAPQTKIQTRKLDTKKMETLNNRINNIDGTNELNAKDANESFSTLHSFLNTQLNAIAPVKTIEVSDKKLIRNKWLTSGLMESMSKQRKLHKKTLQKNSTSQDHEKYRNTQIKGKVLHYKL